MDTRYQPHPIEWTRERVAHLWRYYGTNPAYDSAYFSQHTGLAILDFVEKVIPLRGRRALDFGCGRGHLLRHLLTRSIHCVGLEFSPESAEQAERSLPPSPLFGGVVRARGLPTPVANDSVDVVFLVEVVEHLFENEIRPTLSEIHRILRPGGHVVVTTPHAEDLGANQVHCPECGCTFHRWQHLRSLTVDSIERLMAEARFESVLCRPVFFRPQRGWTSRLVDGLAGLNRKLRGLSAPEPHLIYVGTKPGS